MKEILKKALIEKNVSNFTVYTWFTPVKPQSLKEKEKEVK